jgi:hypothetical protein
MAREFFESTLGMSSASEPQVQNFFKRMFESHGGNMSRDVAGIFKTTENAKMFLETVNNILEEDAFSGPGIQNAIMREDAAARAVAMSNVVNELLNESTQQGLSALRPISLTSFGFQIRSYVKAVMHRVVKTLQAEKPAFKITERKQFLIDINGNKRYFTDAFNHSSDLSSNLYKKFDMLITIPATNYDIFTTNSIDDRNRLAVDVALKSYTATEADGTTAATNLKITGRKREIDIETGRFSIEVTFGTDNAVATLHGEIDFNTNKMLSLSSTSPRLKTATFAARLSSETHLSSLVVGMEHENTTVNIPDGAHIEVELSQEFTDDASRMLGINILEEYTNQMGTVIERLEDISIYDHLKTLDAGAIVTDTFDCTPDAGFAYGKEEWIKREFHPFIERMCIRMKSELQLDDCHFRVIGNPMDIRVPNAAGEEYIFRRNQEMVGAVKVDYDFAVVTSGNTIFYLSSDRVAPGTLRILLIPNSIENNIITVNHYRYANYVSNKYRSSRNPALPTVMVSSRYKTQEYLPVVGVITVANNHSSYYAGVYPAG